MDALKRISIQAYLLLIVSLLVVVAYFPGLLARPFGDDVLFIITAKDLNSASRSAFVPTGQEFLFFRPIEMTILQINDRIFGGIYVFPLVMSLALLFASAFFIFRISKRVTAPHSTWPALCATALYLAHPINVSATIQIDTLSERLSGTFALATAYFCLRALSGTHRRYAFLPLIFVSSVFGFFSKESYFVPGLSISIFCVLISDRESIIDRVKAAAPAAIVIGMATIIYMAVRMNHGTQVYNSRYTFHLSILILKNFTMLVFGTLSYIDLSTAIRRMNLVSSLILLLALCAPIVIVTRWRADSRVSSGALARPVRPRSVAALAVMYFSGFIPVVFASDVSEHNTTISTAFLMPLLAIGFDCLYRSTRTLNGPVPIGYIYGLSVGTFILTGVISIGFKASAAYATATQIGVAYGEVRGLVLNSGRRDILVCANINPKRQSDRYSIYSQPPSVAIGEEMAHLKREFPDVRFRVKGRQPGDMADCDIWF